MRYQLNAVPGVAEVASVGGFVRQYQIEVDPKALTKYRFSVRQIADAVKNNLEQILTLPGSTVICPGHGPLTTVGEEQQHNPFFTK